MKIYSDEHDILSCFYPRSICQFPQKQSLIEAVERFQWTQYSGHTKNVISAKVPSFGLGCCMSQGEREIKQPSDRLKPTFELAHSLPACDGSRLLVPLFAYQKQLSIFPGRS